MPPEGLENHYTPNYYQEPLEKQDFFTSMKAQVFRGDAGENREDGKDDQTPLESVNKTSWIRGYIVQAVYQVSGTLHGIFSDWAATFIRSRQFRAMENRAVA